MILMLIHLPCYVIAQGPIFSNAKQAALLLNPAETGNFEGEQRFSNMFRYQGTALANPVQSLYIGLDKKFYYYNEIISFGLYYLEDATTDFLLQQHQLFFSIGYNKNLFASSRAFIGLQGGALAHILSEGHLSHPDQFDMTTGQFNPALHTNEELAKSGVYAPGANIGLGWETKRRDFFVNIGTSLSNVYYGNSLFIESGDKPRTFRRFNAYGVFGLPSEQAQVFKFSIYYTGTQNTNMLTGGIDYSINALIIGRDNIPGSISTGIFARGFISDYFDAFIWQVSFGYGSYDFSFAYDLGFLSNSPKRSNNSAFELSLVYHWRAGRKTSQQAPVDLY